MAIGLLKNRLPHSHAKCMLNWWLCFIGIERRRFTTLSCTGEMVTSFVLDLNKLWLSYGKCISEMTKPKVYRHVCIVWGSDVVWDPMPLLRTFFNSGRPWVHLQCEPKDFPRWENIHCWFLSAWKISSWNGCLKRSSKNTTSSVEREHVRVYTGTWAF